MDNFSKRFRTAEISILAYIVIVTVALATTTNASRAFIEPIRLLSALALIGTLGLALFRTDDLTSQRNLVLTCIAFGITGLGLALVHQGEAVALGHSIYNLIVVSTGAITLSCIGPKGFSDRGGKVLTIYFFVITILTFSAGGLVLELPPRFNLEYLSDGNREETYSLGISQFFGMGGVVCALLATKSKYRWQSAIYLVGCVVCISLSILGGARGDSLLAVSMSLLLLGRRFPVGVMLGFITIVGAAWFIDVGPDALDQLVLYQRLVAGGGDLGDRDVLIFQAVNLLSEQPSCLLTGCGFGFFQYFFGYDRGLYPHNFIVEMVITFGFPATTLILVGTVLGMAKDFRAHGGLTYMMVLFVYCAAVGLKSQSLLTNWPMTAGLLYYFSRSLPRKVSVVSSSAVPAMLRHQHTVE
jgi:hypothetical protein